MSCLYQALAFFESGETAHTIRQRICNYMSQNRDIPNFMKSEECVEEPLHSYVSKMRQASEWGGAPETRIYCELFRARVLVRCLVTGNNIEYIPGDRVYRKTVRVTWNGGHYEPVKD